MVTFDGQRTNSHGDKKRLPKKERDCHRCGKRGHYSYECEETTHKDGTQLPPKKIGAKNLEEQGAQGEQQEGGMRVLAGFDSDMAKEALATRA